MAHFAKLGVGNIVEQVIVISNDVATTEQAGSDFINKLYNTRDVWKQTSYNNNIRKNFAGIGFQYDQAKRCFYST
jgi:DNA phosphorothioation-dependent restriction protein DptG